VEGQSEGEGTIAGDDEEGFGVGAALLAVVFRFFVKDVEDALAL